MSLFTSRAAGESVDRPSLRERVLDFLESQGPVGATDEEMQLALGMNPSTQRPRRLELVELGTVIDSGEMRRTKSGRKAVVWAVNE